MLLSYVTYDTYVTYVTFQVAYLANMTSPPGSKAAQHFATFMGKSVSLCITFQNHCGEKGHPVSHFHFSH